MRSALGSEFGQGRARIWHLQTDASLCSVAHAGDQRAFEELSRRHRRAVAAFVFHMLGGRHRREDAEDVVQEAFAIAFAKIRGGGLEGSFRALLFTVARNRAIDLVRRERVRLVPLELENGEQRDELPAASGTVSAAAEANDEFAWLVEAIAALPERQRSALLLRELGGLSHDQIADELGTTSGSARQLITRGRVGVRRAAARDERAGRLVGSRPRLREQLIASAALLPSATIGAGAVAGSAAGGWAAGAKLLALVAALAAAAGAPGVVGSGSAHDESHIRGTAPAAAPAAARSITPGASAALVSAKPDRAGVRGGARIGHAGPAPTSTRRHVDAQRPGSDSQSPGQAGTGSPPSHGGARQLTPRTPSAAPLDPVVQLPGKVVGDVGGGLSGKQPLPESVGKTLGGTTDALGKTVNGLLPGSGG